jgi:hypothetical protein
MKSKLSLVSLSALAFALAFAPSVSAQQIQPPFSGPPLVTDTEQIARMQANGTVINPTFTLLQEFQLAFGLIQYPVGGQVLQYNAATGTFQILPGLYTASSPVAVDGYATGLGAGQSVTQITSKATAVSFATGTWTGQITMNNASLGSATAVQFTVSDPYIWNTDQVVVTQASAPTHAYLFSTIAQNGSFVVTVYNVSGSAQTDALVLTFIASRASAN